MKIDEDTFFRIQKSWSGEGVKVYLMKKVVEGGERKLYVAKPVELEFVELPPGESPFGATMYLPNEWDKDGKAVESLKTEVAKLDGRAGNEQLILGQLEAVTEHMKDMRAIAFHKVGIKS
jgi:hypothetical protein